MVGSPIYMAPELLMGKEYDIKADVWSTGVCFFEMLFGCCPFEEKTIPLLIAKLKTTSLHIPLNLNNISLKTQILVRSFLVYDPSRRTTFRKGFDALKEYFDGTEFITPGSKPAYSGGGLLAYANNQRGGMPYGKSTPNHGLNPGVTGSTGRSVGYGHMLKPKAQVAGHTHSHHHYNPSQPRLNNPQIGNTHTVKQNALLSDPNFFPDFKMQSNQPPPKSFAKKKSPEANKVFVEANLNNAQNTYANHKYGNRPHSQKTDLNSQKVSANFKKFTGKANLPITGTQQTNKANTQQNQSSHSNNFLNHKNSNEQRKRASNQIRKYGDVASNNTTRDNAKPGLHNNYTNRFDRFKNRHHIQSNPNLGLASNTQNLTNNNSNRRTSEMIGGKSPGQPFATKFHSNNGEAPGNFSRKTSKQVHPNTKNSNAPNIPSDNRNISPNPNQQAQNRNGYPGYTNSPFIRKKNAVSQPNLIGERHLFQNKALHQKQLRHAPQIQKQAFPNANLNSSSNTGQERSQRNFNPHVQNIKSYDRGRLQEVDFTFSNINIYFIIYLFTQYTYIILKIKPLLIKFRTILLPQPTKSF